MPINREKYGCVPAPSPPGRFYAYDGYLFVFCYYYTMTWSVSGWAAGVTAVCLVGGTLRSVDVVTPRLSISVFTAYTSHITINGHRYIQLSWREKTTVTVTLCRLYISQNSPPPRLVVIQSVFQDNLDIPGCETTPDFAAERDFGGD